MRRFIVLLSAVVASMFTVVGIGALTPANAADPSFTQNWGGAGSEWLPCENGTLTWQFDLAGPTQASSATISVNGVTHPGVQTGDLSWSFTSPGTGVTTSSTVFVTYTAPDQLFEAAVSIVSCDSYETTPTTTIPSTVPPSTVPSTSTVPPSTAPSTSTVPPSTAPSTSTVPPNTQPTRPVPTEIEAGVAGPTSSAGQEGPTGLVIVGLLAGVTLAAAGVWALSNRRGRHLG